MTGQLSWLPIAGITVAFISLSFSAKIVVKLRLYDWVCCQISWGVLSPVHITASNFNFFAYSTKISKVWRGRSQFPLYPQYPARGLSVFAVRFYLQHTGYVHLTGVPSV